MYQYDQLDPLFQRVFICFFFYSREESMWRRITISMLKLNIQCKNEFSETYRNCLSCSGLTITILGALAPRATTFYWGTKGYAIISKKVFRKHFAQLLQFVYSLVQIAWILQAWNDMLFIVVPMQKLSFYASALLERSTKMVFHVFLLLRNMYVSSAFGIASDIMTQRPLMSPHRSTAYMPAFK